DGRLYVLTDLDAPRGRLAVTGPADPGPETWTDLLRHDPEAVLEDYVILDGEALGESPLLVAAWTRHAVGELTVHDLASGRRRPGARGRLGLPGLGTVASLTARPEGGHEAWFAYTDFTTPPHVYRFDATQDEVSLYARPPGTVEVPDVDTRQVVYTSTDG